MCTISSKGIEHSFVNNLLDMQLMNNPPAGAGSKVGKFPKSSKQLDTLNKQMAAQKTGQLNFSSLSQL